MELKERKIKITTLLRWGGTLISGLLFLWLVTRQNWQVMIEKSSDISLWAVAASLFFFILSHLFNTLRWYSLLWAQGVEINYKKALQIVWAGNFVSNFLPSTVGGDGFRMLAVYSYTKRKSLSIGSVILDRVINMSAMICLIPLALYTFSDTAGNFFMQASCAPFGLFKQQFEKYLPKIQRAFQIWASTPRAFLHAFVWAWPSNLLFTFAIYVIARQLGLQVSFLQALSVQTATYFFSLLPISINGYGLRELTYTILYAALGVSTEQASTLALVTRFLIMITTLPGALWLSKIPVLDIEGLNEQ